MRRIDSLVVSDVDVEVLEWDRSDCAVRLPLPATNANKYTRGNALVAAGSLSYPGAAVLCSSAAARSGAGYVRLAVPQSVAPVVRGHLICVPVVACPESDGAFSRDALSLLTGDARVSSLVFGPGVTITEQTHALLESLLDACAKPLVLDADALSMAATLGGACRQRAQRGQVTILTPHEGEMRRLLTGGGCEHARASLADLRDRVAVACWAARAYGSVVVFKGPTTVVVDAQAAHAVVLRRSTPVLATAGTGDVLAGIIGALVAQGLEPFDAAALGVHLHALAGKVARSTIGPFGVIASDIIGCIPVAAQAILAEAE